jgi:hypothetical protein
MPRRRVSMKITTSATSLACSKLPETLASSSFSGGLPHAALPPCFRTPSSEHSSR